MSRSVPESDWKLFRQVRSLALERYCERVLEEISRIAANASSTSHERYLEIYKVLHQRDRTLADLFNDARRSTAIHQLLSICADGLLADDEIARFTPETRDLIRRFSANRH
jgi:hypothetical protein